MTPPVTMSPPIIQAPAVEQPGTSTPVSIGDTPRATSDNTPPTGGARLHEPNISFEENLEELNTPEDNLNSEDDEQPPQETPITKEEITEMLDQFT